MLVIESYLGHGAAETVDLIRHLPLDEATLLLGARQTGETARIAKERSGLTLPAPGTVYLGDSDPGRPKWARTGTMRPGSGARPGAGASRTAGAGCRRRWWCRARARQRPGDHGLRGHGGGEVDELQLKVQAAKVQAEMHMRFTDARDRWRCLAEIHAAPEWLWPALAAVTTDRQPGELAVQATDRAWLLGRWWGGRSTGSAPEALAPKTVFNQIDYFPRVESLPVDSF